MTTINEQIKQMKAIVKNFYQRNKNNSSLTFRRDEEKDIKITLDMSNHSNSLISINEILGSGTQVKLQQEKIVFYNFIFKH